MRLIKLSILLVGFSFNMLAYAIVPVVDAYNDAENTSALGNSLQTNANRISSENNVATVFTLISTHDDYGASNL